MGRRYSVEKVGRYRRDGVCFAAAIGLLLLIAGCAASSSRSDNNNDRQGGFYGGVSGGWSHP